MGYRQHHRAATRGAQSTTRRGHRSRLQPLSQRRHLKLSDWSYTVSRDIVLSANHLPSRCMPSAIVMRGS